MRADVAHQVVARGVRPFRMRRPDRFEEERHVHVAHQAYQRQAVFGQDQDIDPADMRMLVQRRGPTLLADRMKIYGLDRLLRRIPCSKISDWLKNIYR